MPSANAVFLSCNKKEAAGMYGQMLAASPNNYEARLRKAYCHSVIGEREAAIEEYRQTAARAQNDRVRSVANALVYRCEGDYSRCLNELEAAYNNRKNPCGFLVKHYLGETYKMLGQDQKAEEMFAEAVHENPDDGWNRMMCAEVIRTRNIPNERREDKLKRYERAIDHYIESMKYKDPITLSLLGLAQCYTFCGKKELAEKNFRAARELNPALVSQTSLSEYIEAEEDTRCLQGKVTRQEIQELRSKGKLTTRGTGPSGQPMLHFVYCKSRKEAEEAARHAGQGAPILHYRDTNGSPPHYHPVDRDGNKIENGVHYFFPA